MTTDRTEYYRAYHAANAEKCRAACKRWYATHKKERQEYDREYRKTHVEECRARGRKRVRDPAKRSAKSKLFYVQNADRLRANQAKYRKDNPEKIKAQAKAYYRHHREERSAYRHEYQKRDIYFRGLLSRESPLSKDEWPQELVDAKRASMKLRRKLNEHSPETQNARRRARRTLQNVRNSHG